jgi:hypothetical protein
LSGIDQIRTIIAGISSAIAIAVAVATIRGQRAEIVAIVNTITITIDKILTVWTRIAGITDTILIIIGLIQMKEIGTVIDLIRDPIAIAVLLRQTLGRHDEYDQGE